MVGVNLKNSTLGIPMVGWKWGYRMADGPVGWFGFESQCIHNNYYMKKVNIFEKLVDLGFRKIENNTIDKETENEIKEWLFSSFNINLSFYYIKDDDCYEGGFSYSITKKGMSKERYGFRLREHAVINALRETFKLISK